MTTRASFLRAAAGVALSVSTTGLVAAAPAAQVDADTAVLLSGQPVAVFRGLVLRTSASEIELNVEDRFVTRLMRSSGRLPEGSALDSTEYVFVTATRGAGPRVLTIWPNVLTLPVLIRAVSPRELDCEILGAGIRDPAAITGVVSDDTAFSLSLVSDSAVDLGSRLLTGRTAVATFDWTTGRDRMTLVALQSA